MSVKVFYDTNILVYSRSNDLSKKKKADKLLLSGSYIYISTQVINEFTSVATKKLKMPLKEVINNAQCFINAFEICAVDKNTVQRSFEIIDKYKYSTWDSLIIASALIAGCSELYSEDLNDGQVIEGVLKISNPFK